MDSPNSAAVIGIISSAVALLLGYLVSRWRNKDIQGNQRYADDTKIRQEFTLELQRELDRQRKINESLVAEIKESQKALLSANETIRTQAVQYAELNGMYKAAVKDLGEFMKKMGKDQYEAGQQVVDNATKATPPVVPPSST